MDGRWMEAGATPLLESFHTKALPEACREVHGRDLPPAVKSQASSLVHLGTDFYSIPIELGCLSRLRTISFRPLYQDQPLTHSQWRAFLSSAPQLSSIRINAVARHDEMDAFTSPIHLPELRELVLANLSPSMVTALLGAIVSAQGECPHVTLHDCGGLPIYESQDFAGSILSKLREVDAIISEIQVPRNHHIYQSFRGNDNVLTIKTGIIGSQFKFFIPSTGFQFLRLLEIRILDLGVDELVSRICLCSALERFLGFSTYLDPQTMVSPCLAGLCNSLMTPLSDQLSGPLLWPCPNLKYLEFALDYSWDNFSYIKDCIETRYGARDMDTSKPPPVFLQELRLTKWQSQLDTDLQASETADSVGAFKEVLHSHGTELSYEC
ncbi:hypothetical protein FRC02_004998 [Tulasnella sp. 418]|nr:hypothetical protein FRC02_004998 [Tulasnella sp. 418]